MTPLQTVNKLPAHTGAIRLRSVSAIIKCITSSNLTFLQTVTHKVLVSRMLTNVNCSCLQKEKKDSKNLKDLRDLAASAFFMLNALFVIVVFLLQLSRDQLHIRWPLGVRATITVVGSGEVCTRILYVYKH
jgi:hypothetical protein